MDQEKENPLNEIDEEEEEEAGENENADEEEDAMGEEVERERGEDDEEFEGESDTILETLFTSDNPTTTFDNGPEEIGNEEEHPMSIQRPSTVPPLPEDQEEMMSQEEYLDYIKGMMEEQGLDFDAWYQQALNEQQQIGQSVMKNTEMDEYYEDIEEEEEYEDYDEGEEEEYEVDEYEKESKQPGSNSDKLMGMKSFSYLETRILANFIKDSEDERMEKIKSRLSSMKQVKAPDVASSLNMLLEGGRGFKDTSSKDDFARNVENIKEFSEKEWALKNAMSFLKKAGCDTQQISQTDLKVPEKDRENKLKVFLKEGGSGRRRRGAIGDKEAAPELNDEFFRYGQRAFWRQIIENSRPKYPLPKFLLPRHKYVKRMEARIVGPGSYSHDYYEKERLKKLKSTPSSFASCLPRFPKEKIASPASAYINDPYSTWEAAVDHKRHPGKVPLFQSTPCNFRYKNFYVGCGIPPNYYNLKSPMDEFLNKVKSKRGLYDQGSGMDAFCSPVDSDTKKSDAPYSLLGPGSYNIRQFLVKQMNDRYNSFKGKISRTPRRKVFGFRAAFDKPLWPTDNGFPGPTTYNPHASEDWTENSWVPFGVSTKQRDFGNNNKDLVCPDYYFYEQEEKKDIFGDGMKSNFLSKSPMITPHSFYPKIKERNKAVSHKLDQSLSLKKSNNNECS